MGRPKGSKNKSASEIADNPLNLDSETVPCTPLEEWIIDGVSCDYAQFRTKPIPVAKGKEPVWEIKIDSSDVKYKVDTIVYTPHTLIFSAHGKKKLVPIGDVAFAQPIEGVE